MNSIYYARRNDIIFSKIINFIYPPICGICGKLDLNFLCKKCQKQLQNQSEFKIEKNKNINNYFQEHLYLFKYEGIIRKIILDYKFNDQTYLYKTITTFLLQNREFSKYLKKYDIIIPVPISPKRFKQRGYNQSSLIAKELVRDLNNTENKYCLHDSDSTKIEYNNTCLFKIKDVVAQSKLNKQERKENIQGAYKLRNKEKLKNKKILLIDDIFTTGSTVNECCKILIQAKPQKIGVLTLAKD